MIIDRSKQPKSLLEMLQEKNEYISAPCNGNGICGKCIVRFKVAQQNRQVGTEKFFRKNNWKMDTVLHVSLIRPVRMKWNSQNQKKKIEVLSEWEKQQKPDTEGLTEADTQNQQKRKQRRNTEQK